MSTDMNDVNCEDREEEEEEDYDDNEVSERVLYGSVVGYVRKKIMHCVRTMYNLGCEARCIIVRFE
jgi:hypothetical protein